jgi:ECF transporter S component (folate family)
MSDFLNSKTKFNSRFTAQRLCTDAVLIALVVVFDIISIKIGNDIKITFGGLPIILCTLLYGIADGAIVGMAGAFIGQLFTYGLTATTVLWIIPSGVRALVIGLLFIAFKKSINPVLLTISTIISSIAVTFVNTGVMYIDSLVYHYPHGIVLITTIFRFVSGILSAVIYSAIICPILYAVKRHAKSNRFSSET